MRRNTKWGRKRVRIGGYVVIKLQSVEDVYTRGYSTGRLPEVGRTWSGRTPDGLRTKDAMRRSEWLGATKIDRTREDRMGGQKDIRRMGTSVRVRPEELG